MMVFIEETDQLECHKRGFYLLRCFCETAGSHGSQVPMVAPQETIQI